jgi:hypothetical protein
MPQVWLGDSTAKTEPTLKLDLGWPKLMLFDGRGGRALVAVDVVVLASSSSQAEVLLRGPQASTVEGQ